MVEVGRRRLHLAHAQVAALVERHPRRQADVDGPRVGAVMWCTEISMPGRDEAERLPQQPVAVRRLVAASSGGEPSSST